MNNPNNVIYENDDSSSDDSSDYDERLLTANVGLLYEQKFNENEKLFDDTKRIDYEDFRNKYFTPETTVRKFTVSITSGASANRTFSLKTNIKLPTDNIISFKLYKSYLKKSGSSNFVDLIIEEIPEIICIKDGDGKNIIDRIALIDTGSEYCFYEDLKYDENFCNPFTIDKFTLQGLDGFDGYLVFGITYLNI